MSAQSDDHNMAGVEDATTIDKGKGKALEAPEGMEESADDTSDESGAEEGGEPEPEEDDNMEEIEEANIVGSRTRGRNIDFAKAAAELDEDDEDDDDEDFIDPDDEMKD